MSRSASPTAIASSPPDSPPLDRTHRPHKRTLTSSSAASGVSPRPATRRESTSMSSVTGFTAGSDWDEEWEGGEEVRARRRRRKDEPMSSVAVVCECGPFTPPKDGRVSSFHFYPILCLLSPSFFLGYSVFPPYSRPSTSISSDPFNAPSPSISFPLSPSGTSPSKHHANPPPSLRHLPLPSLPNPNPIRRPRDPLSPPRATSTLKLPPRPPTTLSPALSPATPPLASPVFLLLLSIRHDDHLDLPGLPWDPRLPCIRTHHTPRHATATPPQWPQSTLTRPQRGTVSLHLDTAILDPHDPPRPARDVRPCR